LNQPLLAGEPASARYRYLQLVLDRRLGRVLSTLRRDGEALPHLTRVRREAPSLFEGPTGVNARQQHALAGVELAALWARTRDRRAIDAAMGAPAEIAAAKMPPMLEAQARADLGRTLVVLAGQLPAAATAAREQLTASAAMWREAPLSASLHPQRDRALEQIAADLAAAEAAVRR
jgi:hypothetical protein